MKAAKWIAISSMALSSLAATTFAQTTSVPTGYKVEAMRLGPWDTEMLDFAFSSDGRHFAYISSHECQQSGTRCIIVDGKLVEEAQDIREGTLALSPDGKHVAYAAKSDKQWILVIDGKPGAAYDEIEVGSLIFSPDSRRVAFVAKTGGRNSMVVDGQAGPEYEEILNPARAARLDADRGQMPGGVVAGGVAGTLMMALLARAWYIAVDPVSYDIFFEQSPPTPIFSPDSRRIAYAARNGKRWSVVVDGQAGAEFDRISQPPIFSPDSRHFAYTGVLGKRGRLIVDGKEMGLDYDQSGRAVFSPEGQRMGYVAMMGKRSFAVVDDQKLGLDYDGSWDPIFSPDGKHVAYGAREGKKDVVLVLEHFLFYCRPLSASLNQACALPEVIHGRASVMA